jgi:beta-phosphoglucomutase
MPKSSRHNLKTTRALAKQTKELEPGRPFSIIFDMDGVIVDNRRYHFRAWRLFSQKHGVTFDPNQFRNHLFGRTNDQILQGLFKRSLPAEEIGALAEEKEALYRQIYGSYVRPARGLKRLLASLKGHRVGLAVATAAPPINLDFILERTGLRDHFSALLDVAEVQQGKPAPEIYLKAAALLNTAPSRCIAVEDSLPGIESALGAGMKVVAITTAHPREELCHGDLVVDHFAALSYDIFRTLLDRESAKPNGNLKEEK